VYLLPSLMTMGNMFCGYACVVYAARGEFETAAPFIGFAIVLDMLDGRIARLTGTTSEFGVEFDSLADIISFGIAPAILSFSWGLASLG
jgi:CDP-diacylglycerol--serine O-phosphatidyltransferase